MSNRLKKKWIGGFAMIGLFGAYIPSFINGSHAVYAEGENGVRIPDLNNITLYIYYNKHGLMKQKI